jgi:hypothetical protein
VTVPVVSNRVVRSILSEHRQHRQNRQGFPDTGRMQPDQPAGRTRREVDAAMPGEAALTFLATRLGGRRATRSPGAATVAVSPTPRQPVQAAQPIRSAAAVSATPIAGTASANCREVP